MHGFSCTHAVFATRGSHPRSASAYHGAGRTPNDRKRVASQPCKWRKLLSCSGYTCLRTAIIIFALCYVVGLPYVCVSAHPWGDVSSREALSQQSTASFANFIKNFSCLLLPLLHCHSSIRSVQSVCLVLAYSLCIDQMGNIAVLDPSSSSSPLLSRRAHWRRPRPEKRGSRGERNWYPLRSFFANKFVLRRR